MKLGVLHQAAQIPCRARRYSCLAVVFFWVQLL